jgi:hypothetical protein
MRHVLARAFIFLGDNTIDYQHYFRPPKKFLMKTLALDAFSPYLCAPKYRKHLSVSIVLTFTFKHNATPQL